MKIKTTVTTNPDFGGRLFFVEAGRTFEPSDYEDAYGVTVPDTEAAAVQAQAAQLKPGEWLQVDHSE
ncbi:hypothetical protein CWI25_16755 [Pseudomonas aeruginosa]|uniref:hypothetical protein n=1 Tax=Pseudomonas aeruginosa TaxID=287 RepID=UPI000C2B735E|nr:hypothetical protein [Pseudomonas aeruginosa]AUA71579.1 hypothetical protein CWI25_16755 [Pseudomonas aeruginosa]AUA96137.1 hypothetical protein CWI24_16915 [Pseudomonas aeruginosa]EKV4827945.1 hypothetical protein [Pseudomonas aeruginosa]HBO9091769.1 hypothetical protein [Pseudomonas aeruginosa]HCF0562214.1 hypothetical protein [Pseudomonas aeruginosa]